MTILLISLSKKQGDIKWQAMSESDVCFYYVV